MIFMEKYPQINENLRPRRQVRRKRPVWHIPELWAGRSTPVAQSLPDSIGMPAILLCR